MVALGLLILFLTMALNWFVLAGSASLSLRPVHIGLAVFALSAIAAAPRQYFRRISEIVVHPIFAFAIALAVWNVVIAATSETHPASVSHCIKFMVYILCGLAIGAGVSILLSQKRDSFEAMQYSAVIASIAFPLVCTVVFASKGINLPIDYTKDILTADYVRLQFYYFPVLVGESQEPEVAISLRNSLMGAMVIFGLVCLRGMGAKSLREIVFGIGFVIASIMVFSSMSRSNSLALGAGCFFYLGATRLRSLRDLSFLCLVGFSLMLVAIFALYFFDTELEQMFSYRLGTQIGKDPRWLQFQDCINQIGQKPFTGSGVGAQILVPRIGSLRVHNLILAAGFETGLIGMLLAIGLYSSMLLQFLRSLFSFEGGVHQAGGPSLIRDNALATALLCLPLVRTMVGGEAGIPSINDWCAIAIVLAISIRTQRSRVDAESDTLRAQNSKTASLDQ